MAAMRPLNALPLKALTPEPPAPEPTALEPISPDLADYLAADGVIDHHHPAIRALAGGLWRDTPEQTARAAFEYVRDEIPHSADVDRWSAAYRASEVLAAGNAVCHGKSHLLVALLRAAGIPAGICYQRFEVLHVMAAVHWPTNGWVRLDARGGAPGAAARFATSREDERVAFPVTADLPGVYAAAPPSVVAALANGRPGVAGYDYLPVAVRSRD
jgi:transglutaminase-like putative cysteine protease